MAGFEADFTAGQARFDSGAYLDAVALWIAAAARLPEVTAHRGHRLAVYQYVADAYARGLVGVEEVEPLSAAVAALDAYCEGFTRAYGTETPIDPKIASTRAELQLRLDAALATRGPQPQRPSDRPNNPAPAPSGPSRGARDGMTIAGGALLGAGVALVVLDDREYKPTCSGANIDADMDCKFLFNTGPLGAAMLGVGAIVGTLGAVALYRNRGRKAAGKPSARVMPAGFGLAGQF